MEDDRPVVVVIGGPNGAGKTTCARTLLPRRLDLKQFVNADTIAAGLAEFAPETVALQAGRIMLARLDELARNRADFAFETTLSATTFVRFLRRLQDAGYVVRVIYVWLRSPELAIQRVAERVSRGGHHVPTDVVARRYRRGLENFFKLYHPLADSWVLCDNSGDTQVIVAQGMRGQPPKILIPGLYDEIERAGRQHRAQELED